MRRETTREFKHDFSGWIRGVVKKETVTVAGESFETSATFHNGTGFRESQTVYGITTTFAPTAQGNVASAAHAHGATTHTTSYGYAWGVVSSITTPEYGVSRQIHPRGTVTSETRRGFTTGFEYDALDRLTLVDPPAGENIVTSYTSTSTTVTRGGSWTKTTFDGFGRPTGTENARGVKTAIGYDVAGRKDFQSYPYTGDPHNGGDTFAHDGLDRLVHVTHADDSEADHSEIKIAYDGLQQTITDENDHVTVQKWHAFGHPSAAQLGSVVDAKGETWAYGYNAVGSLNAVDAPGADGSRSWNYGIRNLLESETHPESGTTTYNYDSAGRLNWKKDANQQTIHYHYDDNDRLRHAEVANKPAQDLRFTYDHSDNRLTASSAGVSTTFDYDAANRLISRIDVIGGRSFTVGYDYDGRDNLVETTYPGGRSVFADYDAANRIEKVYESATVVYAEGPSAQEPGMRYHPSGVLASYRSGNGIAHTTTLTDDRRQFVKTIDAAPLALTYSYDDAGNVEGIDDRSSRNRDSAFTYDPLDRLTGVTGFGASSFTYDALGNRSTKNGVAYGYHGGTQRMTSDGALGYTHDANGNTKTAGGDGYDYSAFNMMTRATVAGVPTDYAYDADQQRRMRTGPGATEYFIHGPGFVPLAEYKDVNGTLTWQRDYIYAGARLIASVAPATGGTPTYTFTDDPLVAGTTPAKAVHLTEVRAAVNTARQAHGLSDAIWTDPTIIAGTTSTGAVQITELRAALHDAYVAAGATPPSYTDPSLTPDDPIKAVHLQELRAAVRALPAPASGGLAYYHLDALGSVRAVTNATGAVVRQHDYLAFGEEFEPEAGTDARRFTGKERDAETGLDYFGARYYAQDSGRFVTVDPVVAWKSTFSHPQLWNRYAYGLNNPMRYVDPDGRCIWDACVIEGAAAGYGTYLLISAVGAAATTVIVTNRKEINDTFAALGRGFREAVEWDVAWVRDRVTAAKDVALPSLDRTGKLHGALPEHVPQNWTRTQMEDLATNLRESIRTRKEEQQRLGEDGPHRDRIRREEQLLRQVEKKLKAS